MKKVRRNWRAEAEEAKQKLHHTRVDYEICKSKLKNLRRTADEVYALREKARQLEAQAKADPLYHGQD